MPDPVLPRIARRDPRATQELLDRYGSLLWSIARRFATDPADAEDAVQDILLDLWTKADRFDPSVGAEASFITMVARRKLIDRYRRRAARPQPQALDEAHDVPAPEAVATADRTEDVTRVLDVMRELPGERRRVLDLALRVGLTHDEIASKLGLALGTVKSHARRGLMQIRDALARVATAGASVARKGDA